MQCIGENAKSLKAHDVYSSVLNCANCMWIPAFPEVSGVITETKTNSNYPVNTATPQHNHQLLRLYRYNLGKVTVLLLLHSFSAAFTPV